jgi:hypothetical protein
MHGSWAQRHHIARVIVSTLGQVLDAVDVQDWLAGPAGIWWHAGAPGTLVSTAGANEQGPLGGGAAREVSSHGHRAIHYGANAHRRPASDLAAGDHRRPAIAAYVVVTRAIAAITKAAKM